MYVCLKIKLFCILVAYEKYMKCVVFVQKYIKYLKSRVSFTIAKSRKIIIKR